MCHHYNAVYKNDWRIDWKCSCTEIKNTLMNLFCLSLTEYQTSPSKTISFNMLTSIPVTEKQRQATFPRCPCSVTTSLSSCSFHTLTERSQEPVAWSEPTEKDSVHVHLILNRSKQTYSTHTEWVVPPAVNLMRMHCSEQLRCDPATPEASRRTKTSKQWNKQILCRKLYSKITTVIHQLLW